MKIKKILTVISVILMLSIIVMIVMPISVSAVGAPVIKADADSWDRSEGNPEYAIDGDPDTFWHSLWNLDAARDAGLELEVNAENDFPQILIVEFDGVYRLDCIGYMSRNYSGNRNGTVLEYEFWATETGSTADLHTDDGWQKIASGTWNEEDEAFLNQDFAYVEFDLVKAKAIKLKVLDGLGGWACCAALEFGFVDVPYEPMEGFTPKTTPLKAGEVYVDPNAEVPEVAGDDNDGGESAPEAQNDGGNENKEESVNAVIIIVIVIAAVVVVAVIIIIIVSGKKKDKK